MSNNIILPITQPRSHFWGMYYNAVTNYYVSPNGIVHYYVAQTKCKLSPGITIQAFKKILSLATTEVFALFHKPTFSEILKKRFKSLHPSEMPSQSSTLI